jgi:pimeloyl-ACP methyl ester carboxylesterase
MESSGLQTATVDGINIAYQRAGSGPTLVLLHGFICDSRAWDPQIEDLSRDFDVIAWDAPGCGQSDDAGEHFSMTQNADCLAGLLTALEVGPAHIGGLSWGGTCALEFYRRHPQRVRSLILADAYAGWTGSLGREAAEQRLARCLRESELPAADWIPQWVPDAFSSGASKSLLDEYAGIMSDFHPVGFRAMSRNVASDFNEVLGTIEAPTLLIWGDEDKRSPVSCGEDMRKRIPGSRLLVVPGAGHVSNFEQPEAFNAAIREFLASQ